MQQKLSLGLYVMLNYGFPLLTQASESRSKALELSAPPPTRLGGGISHDSISFLSIPVQIHGFKILSGKTSQLQTMDY